MTGCRLLGWPTFLAVALTVQVGDVMSGLRRDSARNAPVPGYLFGDSGVYAAATDSLLSDGDLDLLNQVYPGKASLAEALPDLEGEHGGEFGLSKQGYLTIKQSPVLSVAALPFRAAFGWAGFLIFNLVVLNLLLIGMVKLAGDSPAARAVVLVGFLTTPLWRYSYNFSPDLFLCALLVGSVLAARSGRPMVAGVLAGLAVSTKVYVAALVLPVPLLVLVGDRRWAGLAWFALGGLIGVAPGLAFNTWLFGAPWVTGYERQLLVRGGTIGLADHTSRFTVPPLVGLRNLLFDADAGLWPTAPVWFLWPAAAAVLLTRRFAPPTGRAWVLVAAGVNVLNLAVFAAYDGWNGGSGAGNRYVFPAVVFAVSLVGAAATELIRRARICARPAAAA